MSIPTILSTIKTVIVGPHDNNMKNERQREIITHLKFIGTFERDEKIDTKHLCKEGNHFFTPIKRMLFGESRDTVYNFMYHTIERGFEIIMSYVMSEKVSDQLFCANIINDLIRAVAGLKNIQYTYKDDKLFWCNIETLIESIQGKLAELKERFPTIVSLASSINSQSAEQSGKSAEQSGKSAEQSGKSAEQKINLANSKDVNTEQTPLVSSNVGQRSGNSVDSRDDSSAVPPVVTKQNSKK